MKVLYSDKKIANDLRSGQKPVVNRALEHLYGRYFDMSVKIVQMNKGDEDQAADIFQEALISFYESVVRQKFRGDSSIKTYLYSTVKNLWLARLRKNSRMTKLDKIQGGIEKLEAEADQKPGLETGNSLKALLEKTGEQCKRLLQLYYYENRSMKEITEMMSFSNENSAKTQKYKCMQKLIKFLDKHPALKASLLEPDN